MSLNERKTEKEAAKQRMQLGEIGLLYSCYQKNDFTKVVRHEILKIRSEW